MSRHKRSCDTHPKMQPGCLPCRRMSAAYESRRAFLLSQGKRLSAPAEMTVTQVRQLRAAGYPLHYLARRTGIDSRHLQILSSKGSRWVQLRTFVSINNLYHELRWFPGPDKRAATYARKNGWSPPPLLPMPAGVSETHVDEIAVERALLGERVPLTRAEMNAAWQELERRRVTAAEIARILHVAERTVVRWRESGGATSRRFKHSA